MAVHRWFSAATAAEALRSARAGRGTPAHRARACRVRFRSRPRSCRAATPPRLGAAIPRAGPDARRRPTRRSGSASPRWRARARAPAPRGPSRDGARRPVPRAHGGSARRRPGPRRSSPPAGLRSGRAGSRKDAAPARAAAEGVGAQPQARRALGLVRGHEQHHVDPRPQVGPLPDGEQVVDVDRAVALLEQRDQRRRVQADVATAGEHRHGGLHRMCAEVAGVWIATRPRAQHQESGEHRSGFPLARAPSVASRRSRVTSGLAPRPIASLSNGQSPGHARTCGSISCSRQTRSVSTSSPRRSASSGLTSGALRRAALAGG